MAVGSVTYGVTMWILIFVITVISLWRYLAKGTPLSAYITAGLGCVCLFSVVCLLPLDIAAVTKPVILTDSYRALYWVSFFISWVFIPLQIAYIDSGYFTVMQKIKRSFRANIIFYGLLAVVTAAATIYVAVVHKNLTFLGKQGEESVVGYLVAAANVWGLTVVILLLGYGLVEVPRKLWHRSNIEIMHNYLLFKVVRIHEELEDAKERLEDTLKLVDFAPTRVGNDLFEYVEEIKWQIPYDEDTNSQKEVSGDPKSSKLYKKLMTNTVDIHALATLHAQLKHTSWEDKRAKMMWRRILEQVALVRDLMDVRDDKMDFPSFREDPLKAIQWRYALYFEPYLLKGVSIFCGILSVIVVWCEITLAAPKASIIGQILSAVEKDSKSTEFFGLLFIGYMAFCSTFTMFQLRLSRYYHMHSGRMTDASSALLNASYSIRFIYPLGFNFLHIVGKSADSPAFNDITDKLSLPFLKDKLNIYLPILISIFCLLTLFNVYGKVLRWLHITRYDFSTDVSKSGDVIDEAEMLVKRAFRRAGGRGFDNVPMSDIMIDSSEGYSSNKVGRKGKEKQKLGVFKRLFSKDKGEKDELLLGNREDYEGSDAPIDDIKERNRDDMSPNDDDSKYDNSQQYDENPFSDGNTSPSDAHDVELETPRGPPGSAYGPSNSKDDDWATPKDKNPNPGKKKPNPNPGKKKPNPNPEEDWASDSGMKDTTSGAGDKSEGKAYGDDNWYEEPGLRDKTDNSGNDDVFGNTNQAQSDSDSDERPAWDI